MSPCLLSIAPDATVDEAARALQEHDVSCLAVVSGGSVRGVVSLRDLMGSTVVSLREGASAPAPAVSDVMTSHVLTVDDAAPLSAAAHKMVEQHVHRLFVRRGAGADSDTATLAPVVGVISTRDLMRAVMKARQNTPIGDLMVSPVATVDVGESIESAVQMLGEREIRGLVVVDGEAPVGVFTQLEAVRARKLPPELRSRPVEEAMSYETICLDAHTKVYRAAGHAVAMNVRRLLVVEKRKLVGILTGFDLAKVVAASAA